MAEVSPSLNGSGPNTDLQVWLDRYTQARNDRRKFERDWRLAEAFLQGRQWVGWDRRDRRVVEIKQEKGRERHTANVIESRVWNVIGKLTSADFEPMILWARPDVESESYAEHAQRAVEFAWETELDADFRLMDAFLKKCVYGTVALRLRADSTYGQEIQDLPVGPDGQPIDDLERARAHVAGLQAAGEQAQFTTLRASELCLDVHPPDEILVPPGIYEEDRFPWLIIERAFPLDTVRDTYGAKASGLREERLRTSATVTMTDGGDGGSPSQSSLRDHVLLKTGYEMSTGKRSNGGCVVWAQEQLLETKDRLPFEVKGKAHSGIVFLKHHPLAGRFWAQGVVAPLAGPQRARNKRRSQISDIGDRNLGRVYAHQNVITDINRPVGTAMELIEIRPGAELPRETPGVGPGDWLRADVEDMDRDMDMISGIGAPIPGSQAPAGVTAYAAFALFAEQEDRRLGPVIRADRMAIATLVWATLSGVRRYWPPEKHIPVEGETGLVDYMVFQRTTMPTAAIVRVGKGAPIPQNQAAELQLIFDLFDRSISSGQPLTLDWLYDSIRAGKALPIPKREQALQQQNAELENMLMAQGQLPSARPDDNDEAHVAVHDQLELQLAMVPGAEQVLQIVQAHKQMHLENARAKAGQTAPAGPAGPGAPSAGPTPQGPVQRPMPPGQPGMAGALAGLAGR